MKDLMKEISSGETVLGGSFVFPRMLAIKTTLLVVAGAMIAAAPLQADVYVTNLNNDLKSGWGISYDVWGGVSFTTDEGLYNITSISITLSASTDVEANALNPVLYLANSNGLPVNETILQSFTHDAIPDSGTGDTNWTIVLTAVGGYQLAANTTYMLALTPTDIDLMVGWTMSDVEDGYTTEVPGSNWSIYAGNFLQMEEDGWFEDSGGQQWFSVAVNAEAVPEPSTYAMLGVAGLLGLGYFRRMRRIS